MKNTHQHPLERYFDQPDELGSTKGQVRSRAKPLLTWMAVVGATILAAAANVAIAATPYVNATVEGALVPGVYGRIEIGNAPPPPVLYPQPIVIVQQPVLVQQPPLYLHVPPGHAKKWSKHCGRYNACGRPVYFVKVDGDDNFERVQYKKAKEQKEYKQKKEKHNGNGNGNGNGKHKGDE
jgi:hypothetical protein